MTTQQYDNNVGAPFSQEAEEATIGSILIDRDSYISIAAFLSAHDFFLVRHQHIWRAFDSLSERGEVIDAITVAEQLENTGNLDAIGGRAYLIKLTNSIGTSIHAEVYARLVERTSIRRQILAFRDELGPLAFDESLNITSVLSILQEKAFAITSSEVDSGPVSLAQMLSDYYDYLEYGMLHKDESIGLPTGYRDLDALLGGYKKKALMTVAGRPGSGKSSWMLCNAANVCRFGGRVLVVSLEMDLQQFVERLLAVETGVNTQRIAQLNITQQEAARITEAIGRLANWNMWFWAPGSLTPAELQQQARRIKYEYGLDLLMVDYVQLMDAKKNSSGTNRVQEVSYISRRMKQMARELNIPVVQLAQLSRAVEQRQDKRPVLSDLRESGALEQDSDVVMFLYRDEMYNEMTEFPNQAEIIVAKHRNGPVGTISLYFEKSLTKFADASVHRVDISDLE
ncbi:MAG: replicative DNA helicase [Chloroflexota bacterium]